MKPNVLLKMLIADTEPSKSAGAIISVLILFLD